MEGFGSYYGQTSLHPLALIAVLLLGLTVLVLSRRFALAPMLVAATTMPMAQRFVIGGADFTLLRLLLLAYVMRVLLRAEWRAFRWNPLDTAVLLWVASGTTIMTIHFGSFDAFVNRLGWSYDIVLTYFVARCLLRQGSDLVTLSKFVALLSIPVAALFVLEWTTQNNIFSVFGGVPEITRVREGRLRCQGPFAHPILAGTFWVALLPLIWMLWNGERGSRGLAYLGTGSVLVIVAASASSTPLLSVAAALVGAGAFLFRRRRRWLWIGLIAIVLLLHFVLMDKPVWHLLARVDILGGSTGWHRYLILNTFINNFSSWFATGHENPAIWHWHMRDITNQYVLEGLRGGLLTLVMFLLVLGRAFGNIGRSLAAEERSCARANSAIEWKIWMGGVTIFIHAVTFFGVSYFGQMIVVLYLQLAIVGAIGSGVIGARESTAGFVPKPRQEVPGPSRRGQPSLKPVIDPYVAARSFTLWNDSIDRSAGRGHRPGAAKP